MKNIKKKLHDLKISLWHFYNSQRVKRYSRKYFRKCYHKSRIKVDDDERR